MRHALTALTVWLIISVAPADAETTLVKFGWGAPVISAAAAPFAVAQRMGWFEERGIRLEIIATPGSTDLTKLVATGDVMFGYPSVEPLANLRPQGVKAKIFYTAFQGNSYGLAVPADSPIKEIVDLKDKTIGVTGMGAASVVIARALVAGVGLDPQRDVHIVVVGEAGQTAIMLRNKQVDSLSQFDTAYAMIENAGVKLRYLDKSAIARFPSNGLIALEKNLVNHRAESVALARGVAMGSIFVLANPKAGARMLFEAWPQLKPTGQDEETAINGALHQIQSYLHALPLEQSGVKKWGESSLANYDDYIDFLMKWGVVKQKVPATDLVTNELIDDINTFDPAAVVAQARAMPP